MTKFNEKYIIENSIETIFDNIENEIIKNKLNFIILEVDNVNQKLKDIIAKIKVHFDIFILLKIVKNIESELLFMSGAHGIIYNNLSNNIDLNYIEKSVEIFPKGSIFMEIETDNKIFLKKLIEKNIIPILKNCDIELLTEINELILKNKNLKNYIKFIPLINQIECNYNSKNIFNKLEKKLVLELNNLRQKLLIKEVNDSYESSGL